MRCKYVISTLCIFGTMSLHAEEEKLGEILQKTAHEKVLLKPVEKKKSLKKKSRFVFKDEYDANGIGHIDKTAAKNKSQSYDYKNKSRFKFKFNDGSQQSNFIGGYGGGMSGSMGSGSTGSAGHGGGGRR